MLQSTVSLVAVLGLVAAASAGSSAVFDPEAVLKVRNNYALRLLLISLLTGPTPGLPVLERGLTLRPVMITARSLLPLPPKQNTVGLWLIQTPRLVPGVWYSPSPTAAAGFGDIPLGCPCAQIVRRMSIFFQNDQSQCIVEGDIAIIDPT